MTTLSSTSQSAIATKEKFTSFRKENPKTRIRNAAKQMGCSEAELVATGVDGDVIRLDVDPSVIILEIERLGEVMALTRNDACVHERSGVYGGVSIGKHASVVVGPDIDLRLFFKAWKYAFAVSTPAAGMPDGVRRSLQFFDKFGRAVHKIFLKQESNLAEYVSLVDRYTADDQAMEAVGVETTKESAASADDFDDATKRAFLDEWAVLKDTHDFFPMLAKYKIARTTALEIAEGRFSWRVANSSSRDVLTAAAADGSPIMVFVGNDGCIQIHTGPVTNLKEHGPWYNVLDPQFNLHLNETMIHESWIVEKPTEDGTVTAVEVYAEDGTMIVQFFGARKPGKPELESWRQIVSGLTRL